jgi:hypothetical protein
MSKKRTPRPTPSRPAPAATRPKPATTPSNGVANQQLKASPSGAKTPTLDKLGKAQTKNGKIDVRKLDMGSYARQLIAPDKLPEKERKKLLARISKGEKSYNKTGIVPQSLCVDAWDTEFQGCNMGKVQQNLDKNLMPVSKDGVVGKPQIPMNNPASKSDPKKDGFQRMRNFQTGKATTVPGRGYNRDLTKMENRWSNRQYQTSADRQKTKARQACLDASDAGQKKTYNQGVSDYWNKKAKTTPKPETDAQATVRRKKDCG